MSSVMIILQSQNVFVSLANRTRMLGTKFPSGLLYLTLYTLLSLIKVPNILPAYLRPFKIPQYKSNYMK